MSAISTIIDAFALHLAKLMDENNLSVRRLAAKTDTPHSTINNLVEGRRGNPTLSTLLAIAAGLKLPVKDLFDFPEMNNLSLEAFLEFKENWTRTIRSGGRRKKDTGENYSLSLLSTMKASNI